MGESGDGSAEPDEPYAAAPRPGSREGASPYAELLVDAAPGDPVPQRVEPEPQPLEPEPDEPEPEPVGEPPASASTAQRRPVRSRATSPRPGVGCAVHALLLLLVLVAVVLVLSWARGLSDEPSPSRGAPPVVDRPDAVGEVAATWHVSAADLRPDLDEPGLVAAVDGSYDGPYVAETGDAWLVTSGTERAEETVLHALDPATGAVRWQRELDGVLCAAEPHADGLLCASVLDRDPATGLGTRWRLHLLDPATGADRATGEVGAWITAVRLVGDTFVLLEQRQPAPHAVLRGLGTDLQERWALDLSEEPAHEGMFSDNRIIRRHEPERPGAALDRPRLREIGPGLLAVWSGARTAIVHPGPGELVAMPHCSRLVDDGARLWCNEPEDTAVYSYAAERLFTVEGLRLAFPDRDGRGDDRTRPVLIDDDGDVWSVDGRTGEVHGRYLRAGTGSAFGMTIMPGASWTDGHTLVDHGTGVALLAPDADEAVWTNELAEMSDPPIARGDELLLGGLELVTLDLATGEETSRKRQPYGLWTVAVGDDVVGVGPDEIALLDLP